MHTALLSLTILKINEFNINDRVVEHPYINFTDDEKADMNEEIKNIIGLNNSNNTTK